MARKKAPLENRQVVRLITAVTPAEAEAWKTFLEARKETVSDRLRAHVLADLKAARGSASRPSHAAAAVPEKPRVRIPASGVSVLVTVRFRGPPSEPLRQSLGERGFVWDQEAGVWRARSASAEVPALKAWASSVGGEVLSG